MNGHVSLTSCVSQTPTPIFARKAWHWSPSKHVHSVVLVVVEVLVLVVVEVLVLVVVEVVVLVVVEVDVLLVVDVVVEVDVLVLVLVAVGEAVVRPLPQAQQLRSG